jgi:glycolate oxidase FAD binding subunit
VLHGQAVPAAIEVEWPADGHGAVHVLLEGREDGVAGRAGAVRRLLGGATIESPDDPAGGATYPWDPTVTGDDRPARLKLTFVLSGLADVLATARETGLHVRGSAGAGVAYGVFAPGTPIEAVQAAVQRIRDTCTRAGGSVVVVDAPDVVKAAVDVWGPVPAVDLMRRVKDQFDPDRRLAPGRFVGGI